jgi:hypothetical protein
LTSRMDEEDCTTIVLGAMLRSSWFS